MAVVPTPAAAADVSPFFWQLVHDVVSLPLEELKATPAYECMSAVAYSSPVSISDEALLGAAGHHYEFDDINALFHGALRILKQHGSPRAEQLGRCIGLINSELLLESLQGLEVR